MGAHKLAPNKDSRRTIQGNLKPHWPKNNKQTSPQANVSWKRNKKGFSLKWCSSCQWCS